jgi:hypothetical protein
MNEKQSQIWKYLQKNAVGRHRAIHIGTMASELGFPPRGSNFEP